MLDYRIDRSGRLIVLAWRGGITVDEVLAGQARLGADPEFDPTFDLLSDYRAATLLDFDSVGLRTIAEQAPFGAGVRRAIVVSSDLLFGLVRMFAAFTELNGQHGEVQVFREINDARIWLAEPRGSRVGTDTA